MNNQDTAFKKLSRLKVGALFMEMGTGKTKVALDLIASKMHKVEYVLWICPCSLKDEIESERMKWQPNIEIDVVGCESIGQSDRIYMEYLKKVQDHKTFIIVDESLKIKNIHTKRTKRIIIMGDNAAYKLVLNGTPISKNILDLWTQMEFLSPKILGMSYNQFKNNYCEYYQTGKLKGLVRKHHNIPHLVAKISPYIFDCSLDIDTKKERHEIAYSLFDKHEYESYKMDLLGMYSDGEDINFNAFAIKLQQYYTENSNRKKIITELLNDIDAGTIIFVRFLQSIPKDAHMITGDQNENERKQILSDFKDGLFKTLYITYGCGSFGLNLQFCKNMIFAEHTWDYAQRIQAEARIYRMGQGSSVDYYDMVCKESGLEDMILRCISKKADILDEVKKEIENKGGVKEWVKTI